LSCVILLNVIVYPLDYTVEPTLKVVVLTLNVPPDNYVISNVLLVINSAPRYNDGL